jgi:hypothetical protein
LALAAAVFVVMFLAGAMKALREELSDTKPRPTSTTSIVEGSPAAAPTAAPTSLPEAPPSAAPMEPQTEGSAAPVTSTTEPIASASAESMATGETIRVMLRASVAGAKFYRNGKQVGVNSVIVELAPGEKRAFEVNLAGRVSRKVVVDGSRSEVVVYLPQISETPTDPSHGDTPPAPAAPQENSTP